MWTDSRAVGWTQSTNAGARLLLDQVLADPLGQVSCSIYESSRLVALAPWLPGHQARIDLLRRAQRPDGGWGGPDGYAVVTTLSATTALLAELDRTPDDPYGLRPLVTGGLSALGRWLSPATSPQVPDTIGCEVTIPALLAELTGRLGPDAPPLRLPVGLDERALAAMRGRFAAGALPQKTWACLEVIGPAAAGAAFIQPALGAVGCSAAATAAWLGSPAGDRSAYEFLDRLQARGGGAVPGVNPITYFEPAWVLNYLALGGFDLPVPTGLLDRLTSGLAADGAPAAPGLPADADDTAAVLAALLRHGRVRRPDCLLDYRRGDYFTCFLDERNPSISSNAHVLEALALYLDRRPTEQSRYAGPAALAAQWLLGQQAADGSWVDKWHASAYYATACCAVALRLARETVSGSPAGAAEAIARAVTWVVDTQREDGSWGRWQGTVEETSYAVHLLAVAAAADQPGVAEALRRGTRYLADPPRPAEDPPLWHAKELYAPTQVIRAAHLAALRLGQLHSAPVPSRPGD